MYIMMETTMRAFIGMLLLLLSVFLPTQANTDPFDRALAQVALSKNTARFNPLDLQLYGGGDYRLPFFDSLHLDPWRVPFVVGTLRRDCVQNAGNVASLISTASLRLSEGTRRTLISDPTEPLKRKADGLKKPLREATEAVYRAGGQSFPQRAPWLTQIDTVPMQIQKPVAYLLLVMVEARRWRDFAFREVFNRDNASSLYEMLCQPISAAEGMQDIFNTAYWRLMRQTDLKALFAGGHDLMLVIEQVIAELQKASSPNGFRVDIPTPWGIVALHDGRTDTYHRQNYLLIVDTGGDDTYLGVGGKDTYPDGFPFVRNNAMWVQPGASQPPLKREYGVGIDCEEVLKPEDL